MQNVDTWEQYVGMVLDKGDLPLGRALPVSRRALMIREMILQLKTGRIESGYFRRKFDTDVLDIFGDRFGSMEDQGFALRENGTVKLTRRGLMQVDRLLPNFFEPEYRGSRYT
jgi:oxygen-independent coproporphyrinogen-3 oxidase